MRIYSWNVNGIRAVKRKGFLDWIEDESPDILALQEIRIQPEQMTDSLAAIDGYYSYFNYGDVKGYSGVGLYTKKEPNNVVMGIGIDRFDKEGRVITAYYDDFILINIYFPNGRSSQERLEYKLEFYDAILDYCQKLRQKENENLIICGDYNTAHQAIDLKNPNANKNKSGFLKVEREWIDKFIKQGYIDTYRHFHPDEVKYSWWSYRTRARERNAGWRIDYHFVSQEMIDSIERADVLTEIMGSDHCPVLVEIKNS